MHRRLPDLPLMMMAHGGSRAALRRSAGASGWLVGLVLLATGCYTAAGDPRGGGAGIPNGDFTGAMGESSGDGGKTPIDSTGSQEPASTGAASTTDGQPTTGDSGEACDPDVDPDCPCVVDTSRPCWTGTPSTRSVGLCADGMQTCQLFGDLGSWGPCEDEVGPQPEIPENGVDENCDGVDGSCERDGSCNPACPDPDFTCDTPPCCVPTCGEVCGSEPGYCALACRRVCGGCTGNGVESTGDDIDDWQCLPENFNHVDCRPPPPRYAYTYCDGSCR